VKREELNNIGLACNRLWHLDSNRLVPGKHYRLDLQKGKNAWANGDFADRPLFEWVDERALQERPTFGCFLALLDNYFAETGRSEEVTGEESKENEAFLEECLKTGPIKYLYNYLVAKRRVNSRAAFKSLLNNLWFKLYRRVVRDDSSGFEHVFVGEIRDGEVIGMHSWLQLYNEERNGRLDYQGFIR
jgi:poly(U)-specific endoribonuclease